MHKVVPVGLRLIPRSRRTHIVADSDEKPRELDGGWVAHGLMLLLGKGRLIVGIHLYSTLNAIRYFILDGSHVCIILTLLML